MRRIFAGMAAAMLAVVLAFSCNALSAENVVLMDADTGRVLYEENGNKRGLIASTTKIMTALLICERCNVLDRVRIPKEAVGIEGSSMYLRAGEVLTVQDLLYGLMLRSGNDAAVALAIYCGGTVEGFSELMNEKAKRLNLENTHFENPHGLDSPDHYSSALDLAKLAAYAMKNPIFKKTVSTKSVSVGHRQLSNHNKLLWHYEGANGVKTGYTKAAGRILVSGANRNGRQLIVVTMNDPNDWQDHISLLERGFAEFKLATIIRKGQILGQLEVAGGEENSVGLVAEEDFVFPISEGESPRIVLQEPGFIYAPIAENQDAGVAYVLINGHTVGKVNLVYDRTVYNTREEKIPLIRRLLGGINP